VRKCLQKSAKLLGVRIERAEKDENKILSELIKKGNRETQTEERQLDSNA
jgi:hypothetical protein